MACFGDRRKALGSEREEGRECVSVCIYICINTYTQGIRVYIWEWKGEGFWLIDCCSEGAWPDSLSLSTWEKKWTNPQGRSAGKLGASLFPFLFSFFNRPSRTGGDSKIYSTRHVVESWFSFFLLLLLFFPLLFGPFLAGFLCILSDIVISSPVLLSTPILFFVLACLWSVPVCLGLRSSRGFSLI